MEFHLPGSLLYLCLETRTPRTQKGTMIERILKPERVTYFGVVLLFATLGAPHFYPAKRFSLPHPHLSPSIPARFPQGKFFCKSVWTGGFALFCVVCCAHFKRIRLSNSSASNRPRCDSTQLSFAYSPLWLCCGRCFECDVNIPSLCSIGAKPHDQGYIVSVCGECSCLSSRRHIGPVYVFLPSELR